MAERQEPNPHCDERDLLLGWLAFHRETLAIKCAGLSPEQLVTAAVPPSNMTLLGLVRHLTEMERFYLVYALEGGDLDPVYAGENPEADFEEVAGADPEETFAAWEAERRHADELVAAAPSLAAPGIGNGRPLRWNLMKVIGEYARHNGHADLLRERIDGAVGA